MLNPSAILPCIKTRTLRDQEGPRESWVLQPCRDPWINLAYAWALGIRPSGRGDQGECWTGQYARGSWHDHNELAHAVARHNQSMETNQATYRLSGNHWVVIDNRNGRLAANDFTNINTSLIAEGGGNTVSQGGGNAAGSNGIFYTLLAPFDMLSRPDKSIQMPLKLGGAERALAALQLAREGGSVIHKEKSSLRRCKR
jgi:hypothetical protein